jgi:hypothetical protein
MVSSRGLIGERLKRFQSIQKNNEMAGFGLRMKKLAIFPNN